GGPGHRRGAVRMSARPPILFAILVLAAGCADLPALLSLRKALSRELPEWPVGVQLTDQLALSVRLADSLLQRKPCEQRVALAIRVANLVRQHYEDFDSLQVVNLEFGKPRRPSDSLAPMIPQLPIRFARTAIAAGLNADDSTRAVESCRNFE